MKNCSAPENQTTRRILTITCATALAVAFTVSLPQPAHARPITPPPVPPGLEVQAPEQLFLVGHAFGTQNYICLPSGTGFAFTLFTPQATLFNHGDKQQIITHFFSPDQSPNPNEHGVIRATWQDSRDTSTVWASLVKPSTDTNFVALGAIAWLLLKVEGTQEGPTGGDRLTPTTHIQRLNTVGGAAPATGCSLSTVGRTAFVPYEADYFFYFNPDADDTN